NPRNSPVAGLRRKTCAQWPAAGSRLQLERPCGTPDCSGPGIGAAEAGAKLMSAAGFFQGDEVSSRLHVLTLTPFFPSRQNEVSGCFIAEPIEPLRQCGVDSSVIAVAPIHYPRQQPSAAAAAEWVRFPQVPGNLGLSSAGKSLYAFLLRRVEKLHATKPIAVIHAHAALPCGHAAALLSKRLKIPFVVRSMGWMCSTLASRAEWRRAGGERHRWTSMVRRERFSALAAKCRK